MFFCPVCGNLLLVSDSAGRNNLFCQRCPYLHEMRGKVSFSRKFGSRKLDEIIGGARSWDNVDTTEISCKKCENSRAFFLMIQTRSADEPMSVFYRCTKCAHQWREG